MTCYPERRKGRLTGVWIAEAPLAGVGRVRKRCSTQSEGERWADLVTLTGKMPNDEPEDAAPANGMTWGECSDACKATGGPKGKWKRGKDHSAMQRLQYVEDFIGSKTPLINITTATLDKLVEKLAKLPGRRGEKLSPGSINRYLAFASAVLTFAVSRRHIPSMPDVPWQHEDGKRILWLSYDDEKVVCGFLLAKEWRAEELTVRVLTATGMRWGEFEALEPGQIDDAPETSWVRLWETKTDRPRSIPIPQELARELRAMVRAGTSPKHTTMRNRFDAAVKAAGRNALLCIHSMRHTTATRLVQAGVNLKIVMDFMGHSDIKTTMKYVHINDEMLAGAAKKLSPLAGQSASEGPGAVVPWPVKSTG